MKILNEFYPLTARQIISESKEKGTMRLRGLFQRAETTNRNKRIYSKSLLEREVTKLQPLIKENRLVGELDHPSDRLNIRYSDASHKITNLWMKDNDVYGEIEILNTPKGQIAQELLRGGITLGISSRGGGSLTEIKEGEEARWKVNEDFSLATFDLVPDESTIGATLGLMESACFGPKCKQIIEKANKERMFLKLLKDKITEAKTYNYDKDDEEQTEPDSIDDKSEKRYKKATKANIANRIKAIKEKLKNAVTTENVVKSISTYLNEGSNTIRRLDRVQRSKTLNKKAKKQEKKISESSIGQKKAEKGLQKDPINRHEKFFKSATKRALRGFNNTGLFARSKGRAQDLTDEKDVDNFKSSVAKGNRKFIRKLSNESKDWLEQEMARYKKEGLPEKKKKKEKKNKAEKPENKEKRLRKAFDKMKEIEESSEATRNFLKKRTTDNFYKIPQSHAGKVRRAKMGGTDRKASFRGKIDRKDYIPTDKGYDYNTETKDDVLRKFTARMASIKQKK